MMTVTRRDMCGGLLALSALGLISSSVTPSAVWAATETAGVKLARAAVAQQGVVVLYDPAYVKLAFPGGDIAPDRGVCTDVLVRALRQAEGIDLQKAVNVDMKANFKAYPALWGLSATDRNIDHRRVPNLRRLFERIGAARPLLQPDPAQPGITLAETYLPGDVLTCTLPGNLAHLMLVAEAEGTGHPQIIHNIGAGVKREDRLFDFPLTGHYRLDGAVLEKLRSRAA